MIKIENYFRNPQFYILKIITYDYSTPLRWWTLHIYNVRRFCQVERQRPEFKAFKRSPRQRSLSSGGNKKIKEDDNFRLACIFLTHPLWPLFSFVFLFLRSSVTHSPPEDDNFKCDYPLTHSTHLSIQVFFGFLILFLDRSRNLINHVMHVRKTLL